MTTHKLKAEVRTQTGRKVKALRREGSIPANVFGKKIKSQSIKLNKKEFQEIEKIVGETGLIELDLGKAKLPVLIASIQRHAVSDEILHVDLHQVDLKEKVLAKIPVEVVGESQAVKSGIGVMVQQVQEIEVEALPTDLPENFTIDISILTEVDQAIHVKDIKMAKGVEVKDDLEKIIVKIDAPQKEEIVVPVAAEVSAEGEIKEEAKPTEVAPTES